MTLRCVSGAGRRRGRGRTASTDTGTHACTPPPAQLAPGRAGVGAMNVVTGPNGCGKSVYLKSVGLVPYMAQIGCFVPATKALVGVVDRFFTRVHSLETAAGAHSTFTIDLNQVATMLRHATPRSLLLIDEFGKGTSSIGACPRSCRATAATFHTHTHTDTHTTPADGVALLAATMRAVLRVGAGAQPPGTNPRTVITTHFREVLDLDLLTRCGAPSPRAAPADASPAPALLAVTPPRATAAPSDTPAAAAAGAGVGSDADAVAAYTSDVAYYQMRAMLEHADGADGGDGGDDGGSSAIDTVVPLFQLVPGRAASSYGFACAAAAGMPAAVVARARAVTSRMAAAAPVLPPPAYLDAPPRHARERAAMAVVASLLATPAGGAAGAAAPAGIEHADGVTALTPLFAALAHCTATPRW